LDITVGDRQPLVTICIPHWQSRSLITPCLRSIRKHSRQYDVEIIVVDNGSRDESLDYLRGLQWIRLIERPEESPSNWPHNIRTAWDLGVREANGRYFVTMHSDVFVKRDVWLRPFLQRIENQPKVAGVGAWKMDLQHPLYVWQKELVSSILDKIRGKRTSTAYGLFPRDYCAMYRRDIIVGHSLQFSLEPAEFGGGYEISRQLWGLGYTTSMIPVRELARHLVHIAHGTAGIGAGKSLSRKRNQRKAEKRVERLFAENWVRELMVDASVDQ
jgi:glycosyltransferase involved in cell wall biosynthesis